MLAARTIRVSTRSRWSPWIGYASLLALAAVLLSAIVHAGEQAPAKWQLVRSRSGVEVYRRPVPESQIYAIRAVAEIDAAPAQVLGVIANHAKYDRWVDRLEDARLIERNSDFDFVTYQAFDMPALFSDRDTVLRVRIKPGPKPGEVHVQMQSVEHPDAPATIGVRAQIRGATYRLRPLSNGKTELDWDTLSDPGGNIPDWVINMLSKSWPVKSIEAMRGELARGDTAAWPLPE